MQTAIVAHGCRVFQKPSDLAIMAGCSFDAPIDCERTL